MPTWYQTALLRLAEESSGMQNIRQYLETLMLWQQSIPTPKGYAYGSITEFLLKHGKEYPSQPLNPEELKAVEDLFDLHSKPQRHCYYNSQQMATGHMKLTYVEGLAVSHTIGMPFPHAWNAINGKVVDTTWRHANGGRAILGTYPKDMAYFGVPISTKSIVKLWCATGQSYAFLDMPINEYMFRKPYDPEATEHLPPEFVDEWRQTHKETKRRRKKAF